MDEKQYKLRFLPLFEDDLNEIVDYITLRLKNPSAADQLVDDSYFMSGSDVWVLWSTINQDSFIGYGG